MRPWKVNHGSKMEAVQVCGGYSVMAAEHTQTDEGHDWDYWPTTDPTIYPTKEACEAAIPAAQYVGDGRDEFDAPDFSRLEREKAERRTLPPSTAYAALAGGIATTTRNSSL